MEVVNVCDSPSGCTQGVPTLVYGVQTARDIGFYGNLLYGNLEGFSFANDGDTSYPNWTTVKDFVSNSLVEFFDTDQIDIDPVFGEEKLSRIGQASLLHKGKHMLFYVVRFPNVVYSISKDSLAFIGKDPDEYFEHMASLVNPPIVFSTDEVDLLSTENDYHFLQDIIQAKTGEIVTLESIIEKFKPIKTISKAELLSYLVKIYC